MSFLVHCLFACILGGVNQMMIPGVCPPNSMCSGSFPPGTYFLMNDALTIFLTDDSGANQLYSG